MLHWITYGLLACVLVASAVTDWRTGIVPNRLTLPAIVAGLALAGIGGAIVGGVPGMMEGLGNSGFALLAGFVPLAIIFFAGGLGGGDVKLVTAVGAISARWECVLGTVFYGLLLAMAFAVYTMIRRGLVRQTFGRIASVLMTASARVTPVLPKDSVRVPVCAGFCVGGLIAGAEHLLGLRLPWS